MQQPLLGWVHLGAVLLAILLAGCTDSPSPTPSPGDGPPPTVTAQPVSTPEPTPAAAALSLYEYLTLCAWPEPEQEPSDDPTYGDISSQFAAEADRLEALTPPAQLSEWHLLSIRALRTVHAIFDLFPKDDVIDTSVINEVLLAIAPDLEEEYSALEEQLSEVAVRLPAALRQQMIEVDCLDPHIVPGDYDEPDDHGNNFESANSVGDATAIRVGVDVEGVIDYEGDPDYFRFTAEQGQLYQIGVSLGTLPDSYVELLDSDDWTLAYNDDHGNSLASRIFWEAPASGDYYLVVGATGWDAQVGSYTLTVARR